MQGSKRLIDFADSAFAIGESHQDKGTKYIKQIKVRATEFMYDSDNVIVCQVHKPHNFLKFDFMDFGIEREHLRQPSENHTTQRITEALELKQQNISNRKIAEQLGVSEGAVRKWFKKESEQLMRTSAYHAYPVRRSTHSTHPDIKL